ncbi:hypothetical protein ATANTOWER_015256 [Ataeniobius toweri]|uniref:Uncharacterized protein n=1 Tax=Ataeniobius toweri TaxID=208326 RepID=A0ABU7C7R7_9TELE|nr:hypothetical protein [Ataeniobius toweri]
MAVAPILCPHQSVKFRSCRGVIPARGCHGAEAFGHFLTLHLCYLHSIVKNRIGNHLCTTMTAEKLQGLPNRHAGYIGPWMSGGPGQDLISKYNNIIFKLPVKPNLLKYAKPLQLNLKGSTKTLKTMVNKVNEYLAKADTL